MNYWHMQMHPDNNPEMAENIYWILENRRFIGLEEWEEREGPAQIERFKEIMQVNDVVAIRKGQTLIALVQIIGGAYFVARENDNDDRTNWIENRRPIRVLDWALNGETIKMAKGTINRCKDDNVETTKTIKDWHERVKESFRKRGLNLEV